MPKWTNEPMTERQKEYAKKLGLIIPPNATKEQATELLTEAEKKKYNADNSQTDYINPESILSRITGIVDSQKDTVSQYTKKLNHAKPGTFDESFFINPRTGKFRFPKYKHDRKFLVKIVDNTDYKKEYWDSFDPEEKENYTLRDFEEDFVTPDIEVESIDTLFNKKTSNHLSPLNYLKGHWDIVEGLLEADEEECLIVHCDSDIMQRLLDDGFLMERVIVSLKDVIEYLNSFTVIDLKNACTKAKQRDIIKGVAKKQEIINRMISSGTHFDLPKVVVPAPCFLEWFENLIDAYILDLKKNADRFHPLYAEDIWIFALDEADITIMQDKIEKVLVSKYWMSILVED